MDSDRDSDRSTASPEAMVSDADTVDAASDETQLPVVEFSTERERQHSLWVGRWMNSHSAATAGAAIYRATAEADEARRASAAAAAEVRRATAAAAEARRATAAGEARTTADVDEDRNTAAAAAEALRATAAEAAEVRRATAGAAEARRATAAAAVAVRTIADVDEDHQYRDATAAAAEARRRNAHTAEDRQATAAVTETEAQRARGDPGKVLLVKATEERARPRHRVDRPASSRSSSATSTRNLRLRRHEHYIRNKANRVFYAAVDAAGPSRQAGPPAAAALLALAKADQAADATRRAARLKAAWRRAARLARSAQKASAEAAQASALAAARAAELDNISSSD